MALICGGNDDIYYVLLVWYFIRESSSFSSASFFSYEVLTGVTRLCIKKIMYRRIRFLLVIFRLALYFFLRG